MKRTLYQKLLAWKHQKTRNPLILKGVRQCGKTYLLKQLGKSEFPQFHYFNFERSPDLQSIFELNLDPKRILNELSLHIKENINDETDLIIFDEIQACPAALTSLKYFYEELPQAYVCAAGSLLGIYLPSTSFPVGKVTVVNQYPMSFSEFLSAIDEHKVLELLQNCNQGSQIPKSIHQKIWEWTKWYFVVGGLPEVVKLFSQRKLNLHSAFQAAREKQHQLIEAYFADMAKHAGKVNALHLNRIWQAIPKQLARDHNGNASRFKFKGIIPNIDRYERFANALDWLTNCGLVIKVPIIKKARQPLLAQTTESQFKLYLFDVGILGALSELDPKTILDYDYGTYKGYFAENFVASEFLTANKNNLYNWKENRSEVEFLLPHEGEILPIEVKSGWITKAKSLDTYVEKYHPPYRIIISAKPFSIDKTKTIHHYPIYLSSRIPLENL